MLRLVRPFVQLQLLRKFHCSTFLRWISHRNNPIPEAFGRHHIIDRAAYVLCLRSYVRHVRREPRPSKMPLYCTAVRLASSSINSGNPVQGVDSTTPLSSNQSELGDFHLVKLHSWAFSVEQFGNLSVRTSLSVKVTPIDPHSYPAADRAFIHLLLCTRSQGDEARRLIDALRRGGKEDSLWRRCVTCDVQYKDDVIHVMGDALDEGEDRMFLMKDADLLWLVEVPMSYDVNAVTNNDGSVTVEQLENQVCKVQTDDGDIVTKKLKSDTVTLSSTSGDINCEKMLQGNIAIATGKHGTITTDRLQGQDVCINADSGAILVKDVYAKKSLFKSTRGDIHLKNLHGDVTVSCKEGNLKIGSLDGSLEANVEKGNVSAYIAKHTHVDVTCEQGDISIQTPPDVQTKLCLHASEEIGLHEELTSSFSQETSEGRGELDVKTKRGILNGGQDSSLTASAQRGRVTLDVQSWFGSLHLQK